MRTFWLFILILALAAAAVLWLGRDQPGSTVSPVASTDAAMSPAPTPAAVQPGPKPSVSAPNAPASTPVGNAAASADAQSLARELAESSGRSEPEDLGAELEEDTAMLPGNHDESDSDEFDPDDSASPVNSPAIADAMQGDPTTPEVDGQLVLGGDGSAENPYEITWDLLVLASRTYLPRQGRTDIPPRIAALHGKRIKIVGYFTVPIASVDPKEVLFMQNMWDGCCIGMPPSPYDAIEVRLKQPLSGKKEFVTYGTLTGTLSVDPFVQNGWLLGMYLMEDGELEIGL